MNRISKMKGVKCAVPEGAFYIFPDMSSYYGKAYNGTKINGSMDLCLYLLGEGHIATVPGEAFGAESCIRISYANSDENLVKAMDRLENALARLK
jgi:aspartate aminotransferase